MSQIVPRSKTIDQILTWTHEQVWTVEKLANQLGYQRQDIAPYVTELIEKGYLRRVLGVGMYRGHAIQIIVATCVLLKDPYVTLNYAVELSKEVIRDRIEHPNYPKTVYIASHCLAATKGIAWVPKEVKHCEVCGFSFNNYIRGKGEGQNLSKLLFQEGSN